MFKMMNEQLDKILNDGRIIIRGIISEKPSRIELRLITAFPEDCPYPERAAVLVGNFRLPHEEKAECQLKLYYHYSRVYSEYQGMLEGAMWFPCGKTKDFMVYNRSAEKYEKWMSRRHPVLLEILSYLIGYLDFYPYENGTEKMAKDEMSKKLYGFIHDSNRMNQEIILPFR